MNKVAIIEVIQKLSSNNPLAKNAGTPYSNSFIDELSALDCCVSSNIDNKIEELLKERGDKSKYFAFNQSVAEFLVWFCCQRNGVKYQIEKVANNTKKNVDVVASCFGYQLNIEVKSPEYPIRKEGCLMGRLANRDSMGQGIKGLNEITNAIRTVLPQFDYNDVQKVYPMDNKVKDCLISAQSKFATIKAGEFNVLLICSTTAEIVQYINYFIEPREGIFSKNCSYISPNEFNNVQAIILSNAIDLNREYTENSWDISKAINLIFHNPHLGTPDVSGLKALFDLFPNHTETFCEQLKKFREEQTIADDPMPELIFYIDFFGEKGFKS